MMRNTKSLPERIEDRLRGVASPTPEGAVLAGEWLPPEEAGLDSAVPELPGLRADLAAALGAAHVSGEDLARARRSMVAVDGERAEAAARAARGEGGDDALPSLRDVEDAVADAEIADDAVLDHLPRAARARAP